MFMITLFFSIQQFVTQFKVHRGEIDMFASENGICSQEHLFRAQVYVTVW